MAAHCTVFLLSPASCSGTRAQMLLKSRTSPLTARMADGGAPIGEVFTFMSSLYFRGKLAYATAFGAPPRGWSGALVIAPGRGLLGADVLIRIVDLQEMAEVPIDEDEPRYREPLVQHATALHRALGPDGRAVLLGSVATEKSAPPLIDVLGDERRHAARDDDVLSEADRLRNQALSRRPRRHGARRRPCDLRNQRRGRAAVVANGRDDRSPPCIVERPPGEIKKMTRSHWMLLTGTLLFTPTVLVAQGYGRGGMGGRYGPSAPKLPGIELAGPLDSATARVLLGLNDQ